jgi:hypothetical protein
LEGTRKGEKERGRMDRKRDRQNDKIGKRNRYRLIVVMELTKVDSR